MCHHLHSMVSQHHLPQDLDSGGLLFYLYGFLKPSLSDLDSGGPLFHSFHLYGFSRPSPSGSRWWWPTILHVWFLNTICLRIEMVVVHYFTCMVCKDYLSQNLDSGIPPFCLHGFSEPFPLGQIVIIHHFTQMVSLDHFSKPDGDYPPYSLG
jgi:hypothetical protein